MNLCTVLSHRQEKDLFFNSFSWTCSGSCFGFAPRVLLPAAKHATLELAFLLNPSVVESSRRSSFRFLPTDPVSV
jgi:hypothetical protein